MEKDSLIFQRKKEELPQMLFSFPPKEKKKKKIKERKIKLS